VALSVVTQLRIRLTLTYFTPVCISRLSDVGITRKLRSTVLPVDRERHAQSQVCFNVVTLLITKNYYAHLLMYERQDSVAFTFAYHRCIIALFVGMSNKTILSKGIMWSKLINWFQCACIDYNKYWYVRELVIVFVLHYLIMCQRLQRLIHQNILTMQM